MAVDKDRVARLAAILVKDGYVDTEDEARLTAAQILEYAARVDAEIAAEGEEQDADVG